MTVKPILFISHNIDIQVYDIETSDNECNESNDR